MTDVSPEGLQHLKDLEALRLTAYKPTPKDVWTIGWGHTAGVFEGQIITETEAENFLKEDLKVYESCVKNNVKVSLSQNEYDAIVSFVYNIGCTEFRDSDLLEELNNGNYAQIPYEMGRWVHQDGEVLDGLVNRRIAEVAVWSTPYSSIDSV